MDIHLDESFSTSTSAEEILRLVKAAVEQVSYSVMITTADLRAPGPKILYVTPSFTKMTGFEPAEIVGRTPRILQGPNTDRALLARMRRELSEGRSCTCEVINYRKDRSEYVAELTIDPVRDANGEVTHWVAVQQDVTERKRAEETLSQAERLAAIGAAMAGLSHESRNALQRMQVSLDILAEDMQQHGELMEQITTVRLAQDDLFQLYEEVREFAAPVRLDAQACDLDVILHDTWATLAIRREARTIHLRDHLQTDDLQCEVDEFAMRQVFRNILENSLAACGDPVEINVIFRECELRGMPAIEIVMRDNGPGIDEQQRYRIFDQFYTTKTHGTGLGMAIVKRLVEGHRGRVAVGADHAGAEILITLPRTQENAAIDES